MFEWKTKYHCTWCWINFSISRDLSGCPRHVNCKLDARAMNADFMCIVRVSTTYIVHMYVECSHATHMHETESRPNLKSHIKKTLVPVMMGSFFNISPQINHKLYSTHVRPQPGDYSELLRGCGVIVMAFTKKCWRLLFALLGEAEVSQLLLHSLDLGEVSSSKVRKKTGVLPVCDHEGLGCNVALIKCTLGSGKPKGGWDFGREGTGGQMGNRGS